MASAIPILLVAYEGDTGLMGFTSTSQGFFMLASGPNLKGSTGGAAGSGAIGCTAQQLVKGGYRGVQARGQKSYFNQTIYVAAVLCRTGRRT